MNIEKQNRFLFQEFNASITLTDMTTPVVSTISISHLLMAVLPRIQTNRWNVFYGRNMFVSLT